MHRRYLCFNVQVQIFGPLSVISRRLNFATFLFSARKQSETSGLCPPFYEVHRFVGHPLRQVLCVKRLLHDLVISHQDAVEVRHSRDESPEEQHERRKQSHHSQKEPPADDDDADAVQQGGAGTHDGGRPVRKVFLDLEHGAVSGPAVSQIGQRDAKEMAETVSARVVTVVVAALAVQSKVPFSWSGGNKEME